MLNLIKMNLYRMLHTTNIYILLIISFLFALLTVSMIDSYNDFQVAAEQMESETDDNVNITFGISSNVPINDDGTIPSFLEYYIADVASGIALLFLIIGSVLFVNREAKSGFVKNIVTQTEHRVNIYISKLITLIIYIVVSLLLYGLAEYIMLMIYYKGDMIFGLAVFDDFIIRFMLFILLYAAFISGTTMLTTITKSTTLGITIGMLTLMGGTSMIYTFISEKIDLNISKYTITDSIKNLSMMTSSDDMLKIFILGIGYAIVYNLIAMIYFTKKDVV